MRNIRNLVLGPFILVCTLMVCSLPLVAGDLLRSHAVELTVFEGVLVSGALPDERGAEKVAEKVVTNSMGMKFQLIPAGEFFMGSPASDELASESEKPRRRVKIARPFYLGQHEVTRGQFALFIRETKYKTDSERDGKGGWTVNDNGEFVQSTLYSWRDPGYAQTDDHPAVNVSWNDAVAFAKWLSSKEGVTYRLPIEAEWEYACRAGSTTRYSCGNDPIGLVEVGNVADQALSSKFLFYVTIPARDGYAFTAPVGTFRPNAFGLYDLHGNVWEWCEDPYEEPIYTEAGAAARGPLDPLDTPNRVLRGGSWESAGDPARAAYRFGGGSETRSNASGFRLVRVP